MKSLCHRANSLVRKHLETTLGGTIHLHQYVCHWSVNCAWYSEWGNTMAVSRASHTNTQVNCMSDVLCKHKVGKGCGVCWQGSDVWGSKRGSQGEGSQVNHIEQTLEASGRVTFA